MRIVLYASTISSVKRADAPRDTSEGKSHGSSGSQRSPSPPPAEVSCDTGGKEEGEEGDFDEAGAGSDQTGGQWGSFP